ncbi:MULTISPECIES: hypothetical protein [unclassified Bradyrhizobium]|uniref:hypothetical protein n=1 Tax=unclassified Bradyrhizobium TaxID=2631580 RepID=UPI0020B2BD4D|nr:MULTISPECIES: hypothetical protein [unclassified Bradyrhizobium]MCP3402095.1 hypothetical protein [Bradyrhizobium sp. CCGB20]MCP3410583.1 hypothetical protein [Bradyrhizobium sp. CCGB01]
MSVTVQGAEAPTAGRSARLNVKHYRAYQVDPDGSLCGCIDLVCGDDEQAKREAVALVSIRRIELWRLDKRIAQFESRDNEFSRAKEPLGHQ